MRTPALLATILSLFVLTSCVVSKKKYESLESAKRNSDQRASQLKKENSDLSSKLKLSNEEKNALDKQLEELKKEYNQLKNQMMANNSQKTVAIDELNRKLTTLSGDKSALKDSLQSAITRYQAKSENLRKKQEELKTQVSSLADFQQKLKIYNEQIEKIYTTLNDLLITKKVNGILLSKANGQIRLQLSGQALFDGAKTNDNGKLLIAALAKTLKQLDFCEMNISANWTKELDGVKAWEKTKLSAGVILEQTLLNGFNQIERFSICGEKAEWQKISSGNHEIAITLYPNFNFSTNN